MTVYLPLTKGATASIDAEDAPRAPQPTRSDNGHAAPGGCPDRYRPARVRVKHPAGTVETHAGLARLEGGWVEFIPADGTYNERPSWTSGGEYLHDDVCAVAWPAARVCQVEWLIRENEAGPDLCAGGAELAEASCA